MKNTNLSPMDIVKSGGTYTQKEFDKWYDDKYGPSFGTRMFGYFLMLLCAGMIVFCGYHLITSTYRWITGDTKQSHVSNRE